MRPTTAFIRIVPVILLAACATAGGAPGTSAVPRNAARRPSVASARDPLTSADIARVNASSAYDAIVKLRATFLNSRGVTSFLAPVQSVPVVFVDGMEIGGLFELRSIPAGDVHEIRFLNSGEATFRYGQGYMAGVILVTTKR